MVKLPQKERERLLENGFHCNESLGLFSLWGTGAPPYIFRAPRGTRGIQRTLDNATVSESLNTADSRNTLWVI